MFDLRDVSWVVAITRAVLSVVVLAAALVILDLVVYFNSTSNSFDERVAAAFKDSFDYGYTQTFDATYQHAKAAAFDKGYDKGYELSQQVAVSQPVARLVKTHNPTYAEMMDFLAHDNTHLKPYIDGVYVCFDYAADMNNNADAAGIQAAYVRLRSNDWGHAVVAFQTTDRGLIFIEPQSNAEVKLVVGEPYPWSLVGAASPLSSSDPITAIELIW